MNIFSLFSISLIITAGAYCNDVLLYSIFSWDGISGNVTFSLNGTGVSISVNVERVGVQITPEPTEYDWAIYEFPVRFDRNKRCDSSEIGKKIIDLTKIVGKIVIPSNRNYYTDDQISLIGPNSIWGRSVKITGNKTTCGPIIGVGTERVFEARFHSPIGGSIWIRSWVYQISGGVDGSSITGNQLSIITDIFNTFDDEITTSTHKWNLYITDIIDEVREYRTSCNFLTDIYDLEGRTQCAKGICPMGDLTSRYGNIIVGSIRSRFSKMHYLSSNYTLPKLSGRRQLYVGVEDDSLQNHVYACARVRPIIKKSIKALFSDDGIKGVISIDQESVFSYSELKIDLKGLNGKAGGFHVHELPVVKLSKPASKICSDSIGHYNPYGIDAKASPSPTTGSHDQYELGDLSGKHGGLFGQNSMSATVIDHNLPLFGPRSVVGRNIVIHKENGERWICSNLRLDIPMIKAVALFRYPFVGEIIMEQDSQDSLADTTIYVGPLLYSDGSHNDTHDHDWQIHLNIPGKDFYDWQNRCRSTGDEIFNPYKISSAQKVYRPCNRNNPERCMVGDLARKHGPLKVSGSTETALKSRMVFTDSNLPLTGPKSLQKRSIVLFDKTAPKHRGNKTACTRIYRRFRYKGGVNEWSSASATDKLEGKIEFIQETPFDTTNTLVQIEGVKSIASGYHVHMVPVPFGFAFPCENSILYGHYNPTKINPKKSPRPAVGTKDQYEVGDLSGKYGTLDGKTGHNKTYNDTSLALFGSSSIMGRSVVIHKKDKNERWFCGSIGWGFALSEARQVALIASFHNKKGFAWGYIRMRQLIYHDGSLSETYIEINLRHPGLNNKNVTRGHNWSVYVNPVGVDASVKFFQSRCVAAGYRWNPFLIQLAHPNDVDYYDKQCIPEFPLRCDAGDLSGRLGPIDLGDKRYVFMDKNLPLEGEHNILGKAIIIHNEKGKVERFACGNIKLDHDIIKWVNLKLTPSFSPLIFIDEMRLIMDSPEWFLAIDQQTVKFSEDNECISFKIIFTGPDAHRLEVDFSSLLSGGILDKPTVSILGVYPDPKRKKRVLYRSCGISEENDLYHLEKNKNWWEFSIGNGGITILSNTYLLLRGLIIFIIFF